jgi:hypothetical protein
MNVLRGGMRNSIHQITLLKRLGLAILFLQIPALAQQATLSLGSGSTAQGGSASLALGMTTSGGEQPASVQWTFTYPAADITSVTVTAGTSDSAASKALTCSSTPGSTICVTAGMNNNVIADGNLANAIFVVSPAAPDAAATIQVTGVVVSSPAGLALPGTGSNGAITIARVAPTVSGLSCSPATVSAPGTSACTVTLSSATTSALTVTLASGNTAVTVPASVVVAAGASSASFTATAGTISSAQTAKLTASSGVSSQSFTLNLTVPVFTISGSAGTSGATLTLTGKSGATTTSGGTGSYSFTGLPAGTYTVTPSLTGFAFTPGSTTVTITNANATVNFTAASTATFMISGTAGTGSATLTLTGKSGATTAASSTGSYSFTGLAPGSYTVTPSMAGFAFTPGSTTVTIGTTNQTVNFTAVSTATFTISGSTGTGSATVTLTGKSGATTTSSAAGSYSFAGLAAGTYTVTPSKSGFTFTPGSTTVTISANQTVSFTAAAQTWTISGSTGMAGALVTLAGTTNGSMGANSSGAYSFTNLPAGTYTLTPSMAGATFTPASTTVTISGNQTVNFTSSTATFTISGSAGTGGATLTLSGKSGATATAGSTGSYSFPGLAAGTYTVTPSKSGFTFSPASTTLTISANQTVSFTAKAGLTQTYTISGIAGTAGATVTLTGSSGLITTASAAGAYSFAGLSNGTYTVTPTEPNFTFTPASATLVINGANASANFSAVDPPTPTGTPLSLVQFTQDQIASGKSVSVTFNGPTKSGNTIVAYAIWSNSGSVSLKDTEGDTFVSPRNATTWSNGYKAQVFYATNIAGGTNSVTATFSTSVNTFGVLYIHEFAGINTANPVDVSTSASGSSSTLNSGFATTTTPGDLIFGAGVSDQAVTAAGLGFTAIDLNFGNITEGKFGSSPGSYAATATHNGNSWAMEMVAFRPASGVPVTTLPPVPTNLQSSKVTASSFTLSWSEPASNVAVEGYNVYRNGVQVGTSTSTSFADTGLSASMTYSYTVEAVVSSTLTSAPSQQLLVSTMPAPQVPPSLVQLSQNQVANGTSVSDGFSGATKAGNTIVAYVIWSNAASVSLTDSRGNSFVSAVAPTTWGFGYSSQVFYASNIAGGADTVKATFQQAVNGFGVLYIHEYAGISAITPVDVTAAASGAGSTLNSGLATTTSANDLLFGAGVSDYAVTATGPGFTALNTNYGNITESRIATTPGAYDATATHNGTNWGMQMVAFRAAH